MRTLQEKYNGIQEGKFSKEHFLAEARMQHPQIITRFNGYDDAVQILKNKGMIQEAVKTKLDEVYINFVPGRVYASKNGKLTYITVVPPGGSYKGQKNPTQENLYLFADESGKKGFGFTIEQIKQARMDPMSTRGDFGNLPNANIVTLDGTQGLLDMIANATVKKTVSGPELNEAKLTKKSLTDYRYKPTNEMDKYPYEQILRGLRVELEVAGVYGTPTAEEYSKALAKVSKNLAKDSIFYTNQLAGVNPKVDLHDKMVDVTAKNTVDTFNGMKKIKDLKEDHSKNPDDKYTVRPCKTKGEPWAVWEGEKRVKGFATKGEAKEYADKQNKKQGLTESVLKEGIKNLIKKALMENEEDTYEMQGPKSDTEYKRELENYLEDNQIYGYTDMLFDILTAPDEEQVADNLADFLDDHQIYGYNKGLLAIFRDYANRDQSEDEWDEADYERMSNSIEDKKAPEIPGFEGTRDALDNLFESKSLKDLLN